MPKMTDDDLLSLIQILLDEADSYLDEEIAGDRAKALRYYGGSVDKLPNVEGRSQMVVTELRDTIEWVLPDLVKIFTGGEDWISIEPQGEEDSFQADVAEDWVNYVIMRQNDGFINTYTWIKDALLSRNGFLVQDWEVNEIRDRHDFKGLTEEEYETLKESGEYLDPQSGEAVEYEITDTRETVFHLMPTPQGVVPMEGEPMEGAVIGEDGELATLTLYDVAGYKLSEEAKNI